MAGSDWQDEKGGKDRRVMVTRRHGRVKEREKRKAEGGMGNGEWGMGNGEWGMVGFVSDFRLPTSALPLDSILLELAVERGAA